MAKLITGKRREQNEKPPKIEFPCDYPIKVLGDRVDNFADLVVTAVRKHAPDVDSSNLVLKNSSKGRFQSVTVIIRATGKTQLEKLFAELKALDAVKMVI